MVRMMPNLPCVLMEGALILTSGSCAGEKEETLLKNLLSPCGLVEAGPEHWIDAHTGLSGSGVAFVSVYTLFLNSLKNQIPSMVGIIYNTKFKWSLYTTLKIMQCIVL